MKRIVIFLLLTLSVFLLASCNTEAPASNNTDPDNRKLTEVSIERTPPYLRIHYIDAGQADATLMQMVDEDESYTILIDTGDWNATDVLSYLQSENINEIDLIVVTHPHADHIGQLDKIIRQFDVAEVWMNGDVATSQVFANALKAIEEKNVDYYEPRAGETFDIGKLQVDIIHPADLTLNTNSNSISMRMQFEDTSFLFTGDAERQAEEKMLASGVNLNAKILHLGHHGSKTSSTEAFLHAVNPEIAIYSAGVPNSYGLPDQEVIDRVKNLGIHVYGTDDYGTIIVETDGAKYQIMTEKQGTLPTPIQRSACIDINAASSEELQKIIHIGEKLADELIALRPYQSIDDLMKIKGIGDSRLDDIKQQNLACIGG